MNGILYFSSTGNSLHIAQKVQRALTGEIKYIPNYHGDGSEFEKLFLITPVYSYGMPSFVYDLIPRLDNTKELIVIQNYGGMVSGADYLLFEYANEHKLNIKSIYTIKMPENFTLSFTVPKLYLRHTLKKSDARIDSVIQRILSQDYSLPKKQKTKKEAYLTNMANWHLIAKDFTVTDACIQCGKCISICPAENIFLADGKIQFADKCVACLGCYHRCPRKAIIYKGKKKQDRYVNPNVAESSIGKDL